MFVVFFLLYLHAHSLYLIMAGWSFFLQLSSALYFFCYSYTPFFVLNPIYICLVSRARACILLYYIFLSDCQCLSTLFTRSLIVLIGSVVETLSLIRHLCYAITFHL